MDERRQPPSRIISPLLLFSGCVHARRRLQPPQQKRLDNLLLKLASEAVVVFRVFSCIASYTTIFRAGVCL